MNTIAGLQRARAGVLRFAGVPLDAVPSHLVCRHGIALVPEGRRLFTRRSVEENLEVGCRTSFGRWRSRIGRTCSRRGRIVAEGPPDLLRREVRIQEAYLGLRETAKEA